MELRFPKQLCDWVFFPWKAYRLHLRINSAALSWCRWGKLLCCVAELLLLVGNAWLYLRAVVFTPLPPPKKTPNKPQNQTKKPQLYLTGYACEGEVIFANVDLSI